MKLPKKKQRELRLNGMETVLLKEKARVKLIGKLNFHRYLVFLAFTMLKENKRDLTHFFKLICVK